MIDFILNGLNLYLISQ